MENQTVKDRAYLFCRYKKIPVAQFEQRCGLSNGYISSMRRGFGREKLENVLREYPELNRDWLLYGEGEMLNDMTTPKNISQTINGIGDNHIKITTMDKAIEEIAAQRKLTEEALRQNKDLVDIIKNLTAKK